MDQEWQNTTTDYSLIILTALLRYNWHIHKMNIKNLNLNFTFFFSLYDCALSIWRENLSQTTFQQIFWMIPLVDMTTLLVANAALLRTLIFFRLSSDSVYREGGIPSEPWNINYDFPTPIHFCFFCGEVVQFWSMRCDSKSAGHFWENIVSLPANLGLQGTKPNHWGWSGKMKESRFLIILLICKLTNPVSGLPLNLGCDAINSLMRATIFCNLRENHSHHIT